MIVVAYTLLGITSDLAAVSTTDESPWVDLGFAQMPNSDLIKKSKEWLQRTDNGRLDRNSPGPDAIHVWYRWTLFKDVAARRRGTFLLDGPAIRAGLPRVQVYVEMAKVFSSAEHQRMVEEVFGAVGGGVWDVISAPGVHVRRRQGVGEVTTLLRDLEREWSAAASIARSPASELAPARPGQRGLPGVPGVARTVDLPENRLLSWWAARRHRHLVHAAGAARAEYQRRAQILRGAGPARMEFARADVDQAQGVVAAIELWLRRVRIHFVPGDRIPEVVGLGVTRDPRRRALLAALRGEVDVAQVASTNLLSAVRERPTSALFEIWGAVALVRVLESLGWNVSRAPVVDGGYFGPSSLQRSTWQLTYRDEVLTVVFEPHVSQPAVHLDAGGPRRHRLQRIAPGSDLEDFVCVGKVPSPDYVLMLQTPDGAAFSVGDACASDLSYLQASTNQADLENLRTKVAKIAYDYSQFIGLRTPAGVVRCSASASFLLVPGSRIGWRSFAPMADVLDHHGVGLLAASPIDPAIGSPIDRDDVAALIETLRAHSQDQSHWMPLMPGDRHPTRGMTS